MMYKYLPTIIMVLLIIILMVYCTVLEQQIVKLEQQQYADRRYIKYLEDYLKECALYWDFDEVKRRYINEH